MLCTVAVISELKYESLSRVTPNYHIICFYLQWQRGQSFTCRNTIVSRHSSNTAEDSWFSTQFISRSTAQAPTYVPITVKLSHSFLSCVPKRIRLHYYPSASDPGSSSGTANYIHIGDEMSILTNTHCTFKYEAFLLL